MRCEPCQGTGLVTRWRVITTGYGVAGRQRVLRREPCADCGGCGTVSCCEGPERDAGAIIPEEASR